MMQWVNRSGLALNISHQSRWGYVCKGLSEILTLEVTQAIVYLVPQNPKL
jgi:hypothetical protein